ncbi:MAG: N-acetylmuramoyl-L-alanine amidase [Deltaproteobacteria bacterium]
MKGIAIHAAYAIVFILLTAGIGHGYVSEPEGPCSPLNLIVLDPGHGGEDSGAIGPEGVKEKDVVLSVALKLKRLLVEQYGCNVEMTRKDDVFIPLKQRPAFANRAMADVFISIHANASPKRDSSGIETFFLSIDATDEEARRVAAFENSFADPALAGPSAAGDDIKDILWDMTNTESHHESQILAESMHLNLIEGAERLNRGIRQAPFAVLFGSAMPAVLVEIGFISNHAEEKWLETPDAQAIIAGALAKGILGFKDIMQKASPPATAGAY